MLVTVTNTSGGDLNALDTGEDGVSTGGNRLKPLPHPFTAPNLAASTGKLAASASKQLPVHPRDLRSTQAGVLGDGQSPGVLFTQMVAKGQITFATAAQTDRVDVEEKFLNAV